MFSRRNFIIGAGLALVARAVPAVAQQRKVIGYLANNPDPRKVPTFNAFVKSLEKGGWIDGKNLEIRIRSSHNRDEMFPELASQLVREQVDLIVATGAGSTRAATEATDSIPVLFGSTADPVESGFVKSLSRPGGNVTGIAFSSVTLMEKRLEFLTVLVPGARKIGRLYSATNPRMAPEFVRGPDEAARKRNIMLEHVPVSLPADVKREAEAAAEITRQFRSVAEKGVDAVWIEADAIFVRAERQKLFATLALEHRLPMMAPDRRYVERGALISYGPDFVKMYETAGELAVRILSGAKPGDIAVREDISELAVNYRTAQLLGITVPPRIKVLALPYHM
jgi:putative tryptophan/tyrosine transport system substrate-binding protein